MAAIIALSLLGYNVICFTHLDLGIFCHCQFSEQNKFSEIEISNTYCMTLHRLQMTEAALALSEQKGHNMGEQLAHVKAEKEEQRERQSRDRKKEQEVLID